MKKNDLPKRKPGGPRIGLYPAVSRTLLAEATGYDVSTVSGILRGRTKLKLHAAMVMANVIGIPVEQLNRDLELERERFAEAKRAKKALKQKQKKAKR